MMYDSLETQDNRMLLTIAILSKTGYPTDLNDIFSAYPKYAKVRIPVKEMTISEQIEMYRMLMSKFTSDLDMILDMRSFMLGVESDLHKRIMEDRRSFTSALKEAGLTNTYESELWPLIHTLSEHNVRLLSFGRYNPLYSDFFN